MVTPQPKTTTAAGSIGTTLDEETPDANTNNILERKPLDSANTVSAKPHIASVSASAVLGESTTLPDSTPICRGVDFDKQLSNNEQNMLDSIMDSFKTMGFQSTNLGLAVNMQQW
jgi:deoxyhypusine synthase